jgi:uncharacterized SAM-binding protein YcdF (DUF218 family)
MQKGSKYDPLMQVLTGWGQGQDSESPNPVTGGAGKKGSETFLENKPIEPESRRLGGVGLLKGTLFVLVIAYVLVSYNRAAILNSLGHYLVVEHAPGKSDLIVCLLGKPVERALEAADLYRNGLAPRIFVAQGDPPDGHSVLAQEGISYPESRSRVIDLLVALGVPRGACFTSNEAVGSTLEEARAVRAFALEKGYRAIIIVTSPTHTRRAWVIFKKAFEEDEAVLSVVPSRYSNFNPDGWWKTNKYTQDVILEYQKLIYRKLISLW